MMIRHGALLGLLLSALAFAQNPNPAYVLGPDSQPKPGVPKGKTTKYTWDKSAIFPGTTRSYWVYVPAQYDGSKPACLMVFQDGAGYANETGGSRAPVVFDNLIAEGSMPVTIGLFVDPGITPGLTPEQMGRFHRSEEYDGLGDRYARFLIEELIPEVAKQYKISPDPNDRGLAGGSSGGIASFNAAWERPDAFRRVISYIGSFANLRGADTLSNMVRKMEPKPLRIFMQDGSADQSIYGGSWFQANQSLFSSLEYSGYDVKFVIGTEGHSGRQGSAILPDALRWLWREYPKPIEASKGGPGSRHYITDFLDPAADWRLVGEGYGATGALAIDKAGAVYFADSKAAKIYKVAGSAKPEVFRENAPVDSLMLGPDGRWYASELSRSRIVSFAADGSDEQVVVSGVEAQDLLVNSKGVLFYAESVKNRITAMGADKKKAVVFQASPKEKLNLPWSLSLTPDEHLMDVADRDSRWIWSFEVAADNTLRYGSPFHHLESPDESSEATNVLALTHDSTGHVYAATALGIQISDPPGRVVGIIRSPEARPVTSVIFGGPKLDTLYATTGGKLYERHMRRTGSYPWQPVKQPRPQL